jgi:hypothetical protein
MKLFFLPRRKREKAIIIFIICCIPYGLVIWIHFMMRFNRWRCYQRFQTMGRNMTKDTITKAELAACIIDVLELGMSFTNCPVSKKP